MAIYSKISGLWKENKTLYTKISGVWKKVSFAHVKVSGIWKNVFTDEYVYTFTANASNVNFATLIGAENVSKYTKFKIIVNSGVTISGTNGANGANGNTNYAKGSSPARNCRDSALSSGAIVYFPANSFGAYHTSNGTPGSLGSTAINFTGMSGKTITIVNNGIIRGGNGGIGGVGGNTVRTLTGSCGLHALCALSGAGGAGGLAITAGSNTINISGGTPVNGAAGAAGDTAWTSVGSTCCCGGCG